MIHNPRVEFYSEIEQGFSELMATNGFKTIEKDGNYKVVLSNEQCLVELHDTEDGLEIHIMNPANPTIKYWPNQIYESLGNAIRIPWKKNETDSYVEEYKQRSMALMKYLSNVLQGDFSWINEYDKIEEEELILVREISKLEKAHPIKQSFREQRLSWKEEARKLIK